MKQRALIVEDDANIAESVIEILESLGHEQDWAKSQEEARQKIAIGGFTYVLLDLQIPVRYGRGLPRIENGEHLAREIHQCPAMQAVPIIVMTAFGKDGLEIAAPLCDHGVVDFIHKPFPSTGRTLAVVIERVLERVYQKREQAKISHLRPEKPFQGGDLVFYPDRVELCGVAVLSSGKSSQMWTILDALKQKLDNGRYKPYSGSALAGLAGGDGGQGSIAGSVRDFRRHVAEELGRELGLMVEKEDVIETSKGGYRFNARIVVKDLRRTILNTTGHAHAPAEPSRKNAGYDDPVNERREEILALVQSGERLRVPELADKLGCSQATVKREVEALKAEGLIEFVGPTKTGYYRQCEHKGSNHVVRQ